MPNYKRLYRPGGTYFFTINLWDRRHTLLVDHNDVLRTAIATAREKHPFDLPAIVVLPDHLHCIMTLPPGDPDFSRRIQKIKSRFSRQIPKEETTTPSRIQKGERGIWQRRFWEHLIRDEEDLEQHVNYIHYNPVKHGYVKHTTDWPHSSIHRYIDQGWQQPDWDALMKNSTLDLD
ncbi:transposase [Phycisphaeraceae bacterium D3-23]